MNTGEDRVVLAVRFVELQGRRPADMIRGGSQVRRIITQHGPVGGRVAPFNLQVMLRINIQTAIPTHGHKHVVADSSAGSGHHIDPHTQRHDTNVRGTVSRVLYVFEVRQRDWQRGSGGNRRLCTVRAKLHLHVLMLFGPVVIGSDLRSARATIKFHITCGHCISFVLAQYPATKYACRSRTRRRRCQDTRIIPHLCLPVGLANCPISQRQYRLTEC